MDRLRIGQSARRHRGAARRLLLLARRGQTIHCGGAADHLERLCGCTPHTAILVPQHLPERLDGGVSDGDEALDCGTAYTVVAVPERPDQRLHRPSIAELSKCLGSGSAYGLGPAPVP